MTNPQPLPANFRLLRLELAREPHHPEGDAQDSYRLVLPLRPDGYIDVAAWRAQPSACRVVRESPEGETSIGHLQCEADGRWVVQYEKGQPELYDDVGFRFDAERFVPGEYVSISRRDGDHTFRVVSQQPIR